MDMRRALKDQLANYKIPQELKAVEELPKNAMGKSMYSQPFCSFILMLSKSTRKVWSKRYLEIKLDPANHAGVHSSLLVPSGCLQCPYIANLPIHVASRYSRQTCDSSRFKKQSSTLLPHSFGTLSTLSQMIPFPQLSLAITASLASSLGQLPQTLITPRKPAGSNPHDIASRTFSQQQAAGERGR